MHTTLTPVEATQKRFRLSPWTWAGAVFVLAAIGLLVIGRSMTGFGTLSITFVSIVLEALPFVMLGSLIGGVIEVFLSRERVSSLLPRKRHWAVFVAACMGIVFPVCECAVVPVTRRLIRKGVPFSVAVAYLLAGPIVNPLVAGSTAVAYGWNWQVVGIRMAAGFFVATIVALIVDRLHPGQSALLPGLLDSKFQGANGSDCGHDHHHEHRHGRAHQRSFVSRMVDAFDHAADDFVFVSQFLVVGAFVAALSQTVIERQAFLDLAETPSAAIGLMMVLAVVLNLCSEADAFVAASFRGTLPISAQMAFMVLGPMFDIKLSAMYLSFVRKRAFALIVALMCLLVFAAMTIFHLLVGGSG